MQEAPDLSKIVSVIMQNPALVSQIAALVGSANTESAQEVKSEVEPQKEEEKATTTVEVQTQIPTQTAQQIQVQIQEQIPTQIHQAVKFRIILIRITQTHQMIQTHQLRMHQNISVSLPQRMRQQRTMTCRN